MAASEMKVKVAIIAKETIKPSSPTPNHLRTFHFSLLDQLAPSFYSHMVLFYSTTFHGDGFEIVSQCLKKSLSQALTRFYPLAGRIKDGFTLDCNDEGVDYIEARINCKISDVLQKPTMETLNHFIPSTPSVLPSPDPANPLLLTQLTFFDCGGLALAISASHKLMDGGTINPFVKCWTDFTVGSSSTVFPDFISAPSLLPPTDQLPTKSPFSGQTRPNGILRRYVFNSSKIEALKARSASLNVPSPSRVEAVSAFICKCLMAVLRSKLRIGGDIDSSRKLLIYRAVNLRPYFNPPLSKYCFGNMVGPSTVLIDYDGTETKTTTDDLADIVFQLRKAISEFAESFVKRLQGEEYLAVYLKKYTEVEEIKGREDVDFFILTSVCSMPFYENDFGWGKPTWVSLVWEGSIPNRVRLMDTRDGGGIEAWISFNQEDIALFEGNPEWFQFASLNPRL